MKFICFILISIFFASGSLAQIKQSGYYGQIQFAYHSGLGSIHYDEDFNPVYSGNAFGLTGSFGYFIHPRLSLGMGTGLVGYHNPGHNTFPVFLDLRGYLKDQRNTLFSSLKAGAAVKLSESFSQGMFGSLGLGYKMMKGNIALMPSVGLKIQKITEGRAILISPATGQAEDITTVIYLNTLSFSLGLLF